MKNFSKLLTVCALCAITSPCFAQCADAGNCSYATIWLSAAALIVAVAALMLAIRNYRISKVNMINSTEDFQLMLDSTKKTIDKDIKNLRREVQRLSKSSAPRAASDAKAEQTADADDAVEMPSRRSSNQRRRSNYHRRRPDNSQEGEQTDTSKTE